MMALVVLASLLVPSECRRAAGSSRLHRDVVTTQGVARGYLAPRPPHYAFLGVPYARPPTQKHRFKAPQPSPRWDGTFEATHQVKCPQPDGEGDENCLVVNVFAPQHGRALPVLVLVHGGEFQHGWGHYQPPVRLLEQNVLVATFNYRIGALGFLCLGTRDIPGNAGLKDQIAALYWIQRNIANFGGDPGDVTVHGVGSGAAALEFILLSGLASGLLHKVILDSGTALSPLSMTYDPVSDATTAAKTLGYEDTDDLEKYTRFYYKASALELSNTGKMFLPCIETNTTRALLEKDPINILKSGNYQRVPMLIAYRNTEETVITEVENKVLNNMPGAFDHLLPNNLEFGNSLIKHKIAALVKNFHFGDRRKEDLGQSYIEYVHDVTVEYPVMKSAILHAGADPSPVYLMKITKTGRNNKKNGRGIDSTILGSLYPSKEEMNGVDTLIDERLVAVWSNFIKIGDPTPLTTAVIPVVWQPIAADEWAPTWPRRTDLRAVNGLRFGHTMTISESLGTQAVLFWDNIYEKFRRKHNRTSQK